MSVKKNMLSKRINEGYIKANEEYVPKRKKPRVYFQLPLPVRQNVLGRVLVCGQGDMGQLGLGDDDANFERKRATLLKNVHHIVDVKAGGMHSLLLTEDGIIYSFGCNDEGALGRDCSADGSEFEPSAIELPDRVLKISAGDSHSACLLEDGRVFAWGAFRNSHGSMGLTLEGNKRLPVEVLPGINCCDIASGSDHLVILTSVGKVYTLGCAEQGQLGRVAIRSASGDSRRGKIDLLTPGQVIVKRGKNIEAIWATTYCTFVREAQTGTIWAFGLNNYKQLGYKSKSPVIVNPINTKFEDVKQIAGGQHHTLVLKQNGTLYAIGRGDYGRLGLGKLSEDVESLKQITSLSDMNIVSISCGEAQSFALTDDGKIYAWGMGSNHQLGTGSDDDVYEPKLVISKQIEYEKVIKVSGGGQHTLFMIKNNGETTKEETRTNKAKAPLLNTTTKNSKKTTGKADDKLQRSYDVVTELAVNGQLAADVTDINEQLDEQISSTTTITTTTTTTSATTQKKDRKKRK